MLSSNILVGALAFIVAGVNAGPCRPTTTAETTLDIASTTTAVVIESTATAESASTTIESSTVDTSLLIETDTVMTVATSAIESTTALAAATTTSDPVHDVSCTSAEECAAQASCVPDGINLCICVRSMCALPTQEPTPIECSTDDDCFSGGTCKSGADDCACIDLVCQDTG
ncbi:hypothetical protein ACHAPA_005031 [Fusarium lateritium]